MKKGLFLFGTFILAILLVVGFFRSFTSVESSEFTREIEEENEERPSQEVMSDEERSHFLRYLHSRQVRSGQEATRTLSESTYANGKLTGTWSPKLSQTGWFGYRVDNSAYDSLRNVFYVVSYAGHLYKLEYEDEVKWTLLNQKVVLNPPSNTSPNPLFLGILLPDNTFRLIRSNDELNRMEYSDDEGVTWIASTGASITRSPSNQAFVILDGGKKRIVLHTYHAGYHHLYFSDDHGVTYTASSHSIPISDSDMRIAKTFNKNEAFMWVWSKSAKTIDTYRYNPSADDFELEVESVSTLAGTNLSSVAATYVNGTYHFYLSTINSEYTIYYSSDEGTSWTQKNAGRDKPFEVICPDKPNILISGFEDMKISTNYGTTWTGYGHKLGWDLQHMRTYARAGGGHITLAGLDFGCYISETPEDKDSYTWCNNGAWYAMHYDAASSENFNSIYMANQDRGATAYADAGTTVNTIDVDGTDVLRVSFAKHETSVWTWFYYGRIRHRYNFPTGKSGSAVYDGLGSWWAAPIVASPDPAEDAIYAAYGSNLQKFSYNASTNTIAKTTHPFDFEMQFGDELGGFGYSKLNRDLWYAALNNGDFVYSKDAGETWARSSYTGQKPRANDQSYNFTKNQIVIRASGLDSNKVYYAGVGNVFLVSDDGGESFALKNNGLDIYRMRDFALSPDEKFVFAACGYGGAWVYDVEDDTWYQMSDDPIPTVDFTDVEFIKRKNCVRFGTYGSGIIELTLNNSFNALTAPQDLAANLAFANHVELSWTDQSSGEDGFYIERVSDGDFVQVATVSADRTSYTDTTAAYDKMHYYRVKAFKDNATSYNSSFAMVTIPEEGHLSKTGWSVVSFSSEEVEGEYSPAKYAIDGNQDTYWHTRSSGAQPSHPHYITIDLGREAMISGFRYLPRQDGNTVGSIADYEIYVSDDPDQWDDAVTTGQFGSGSGWKDVLLELPVMGRYVKVVALSEVNGEVYASAAEVDVLYYTVLPETPEELVATIIDEGDVHLWWRDRASYELGYVIEQLIDGAFEQIATIGPANPYYTLYDLPLDSTYEFRVRSYNNAGLSDPSNVAAATLVSTSVLAAEQAAGIKVFPNPSSAYITVEMPDHLHEPTLRVVSLQGKELFAKSVAAGSTSVEVSLVDIPKGIYILELSDGNHRFSQRIKKL